MTIRIINTVLGECIWVYMTRFEAGGGSTVELLCEESPRLPHDRHSRFQLAPRALVQGIAWPSSQIGGTLGTM